MDTDNNITHRKKYKSGSLTDLSLMTNDDDKTILDTTMMSIPDNLHDNNDDIFNDLSEQIKTLQMQLVSAHQEIEDLNSENFRLKSDLQKSLKTAETYKKICLTPERKGNTPSRQNKSKQHKISPIISSNDSYIWTISDDKTKIAMLDKDTQTCNLNIDTLTQLKQNLTPISQQCNVAHEKSSGIIPTPKHPKQKNRLCIISNNCTKGTLPLIEEIFSKGFEYCHYLLPNATMKDFFSSIDQKLKDFTMNDYCLIFIGENDLRNGDCMDMLDSLRNSLKNATHTNKIICAPTYIKGALIYNYKVELFNNLLCLDTKNNKYAYFFDSNCALTHEMFSNNTGKINKYGWRNIYNRIMSNIMIDYDLFCPQLELTNDKINLPLPSSNNENEYLPSTADRAEFFLL